MHPSSSTTLIKGAIGTIPPYLALVLDPTWTAPIQLALGAVVPTLVSVSLLFDIGKKWREREEEKRQDKIRQQRHEYLKRHKWKKRRQPSHDGCPDDTLDYVDKL